MRRIFFAFSLLIFACLITATPAVAKPPMAFSPLFGPTIDCKSFQAIAHLSLPGATDEWSGPLYGSLDGEVLLGIIAGHDGDVTWHGAIGQGRGGSYTIGFGCVSGDPSECTDTLTFEVPHSV